MTDTPSNPGTVTVYCDEHGHWQVRITEDPGRCADYSVDLARERVTATTPLDSVLLLVTHQLRAVHGLVIRDGWNVHNDSYATVAIDHIDGAAADPHGHHP